MFGRGLSLRAENHIGMDIGYIPQEISKQLIAETKKISAMLVGLMRSLQTAD
jgi:hypothetical protein